MKILTHNKALLIRVKYDFSVKPVAYAVNIFDYAFIIL